MQRHLFQYLLNHFGEHRQMAFLSGPRQVGKTTLAKGLAAHRAGGHYFNWDNQSHRETLLSGPDAIAAAAGLDHLVEQPQILAFDELHKKILDEEREKAAAERREDWRGRANPG